MADREWPVGAPEFPPGPQSDNLAEDVHRLLRAIDAEIFGRITARSGDISGDFAITGSLSVTGNIFLEGAFYTEADATTYPRVLMQGGIPQVTFAPDALATWGIPGIVVLKNYGPADDDQNSIEIQAPYRTNDDQGRFEVAQAGTVVQPAFLAQLVPHGTSANTFAKGFVVDCADADDDSFYVQKSSGHALRVGADGDDTIYDQNDDEIWGARLIYRFGPSTAMTVDNTNKTVLFDSQSVSDTGFTYSSGNFTVADAGLYKIDVRITVESVDDTGGIRGEPQISLWTRPSGGSYSAINPKAKEYVREDASEALGAHLTIQRVVTLAADEDVKVTITDNVATEPNEQVAVNMCSFLIEKVR